RRRISHGHGAKGEERVTTIPTAVTPASAPGRWLADRSWDRSFRIERSPVESPRPTPDRAMLVAATDDHDGDRAPISKLHVLKTVGRRSLPSLIEATVIPSVLFYVFFVTISPQAAMLAALTWSYGSVLRRFVGGQRIPGVLQLAIVGLTVRTIIGLMSGTFMYFLQPIATTVALSVVFLVSQYIGRPIIARMASDFCPLHPEVASLAGIANLFSGLTLMWAGVHFLSAVTTFVLLVSLPTTTFVALKGVVSLAITITAIVFTVSWSVRTAHAENLVFAPVTT